MTFHRAARSVAAIAGAAILVLGIGGSWSRIPSAHATPNVATATATAIEEPRPVPKAKPKVSGRVNLNTARIEDLVLLPGIGPAKAERIVAWRQKNGAFRRVLDLRRVKGIGFKTLKRLEPYLAVDGATTLKPAP